MKKKTYTKPLIASVVTPKMMAAPLAFFSAATAAASAAGVVVGAALASKAMSIRPDDYCDNRLSPIEGVVRA